MTRKHYLFDIETRCGLGVAVHAMMCADPTLTPDQAISIMQHDIMESSDQLHTYALAAGLNTVELYFVGTEIIVDDRFMALDTGLRPGVSVIRISDLKRVQEAMERHMAGLKMADDIAREFRAPRAAPKRDWEQRLKKQRRR